MSDEIDPALLGAYVDGELSRDEVERIERQLAESPDARASVEALRSLNVQLAAAFEEPLRVPLAPALLQSLTGRERRYRPIRYWWPIAAGSALAASVALAVAVFGGAFSSAPSYPGLVAGKLAQSSAVFALLEHEPSGSATELGDSAASLGATFLDGRGNPCREVELSDGIDSPRTWAVACRHGAEWLVEVTVSRPHPEPGSQDDYVPAAGVGDELIDAALDMLGAGPALGPGEVEDLIATDWNQG